MTAAYREAAEREAARFRAEKLRGDTDAFLALDAVKAVVPRPPRQYQSMKAVAAFHGVDSAACFRCGEVARTERAHVIDRAYGGLDDVQNLVPLCFRCHREQPAFAAGEERAAWLWLSSGDVWGYTLAVLSIAIEEGGLAPFDCSEEAVRRACVTAGLWAAEATA